MRHAARVVLFAAVTALAIACGAKPTQPTPEPELVLAPLVSPLFIGATQQAALALDGAAVATQATWSSDTPAIATVSGAGVVTGVGSGTTTIRATHGGRARSSAVRVVPNYRVGFAYTATVTSCTISTAAIACLTPGTTSAGVYTFAQSDFAVFLTIDVGDGRAQQIAAPIAADGALDFQAAGTVNGVLHTFTWRLNSPDGKRLEGTLRDDFSSATFTGVLQSVIQGSAGGPLTPGLTPTTG